MYRVIFELTPDVAQIYQEKFKLHEWNGDSTNKLPLSATYVIAQDGTVQWAFLDADYRKRAEPDDILEALDTL
jgi:peroxiredoxin